MATNDDRVEEPPPGPEQEPLAKPGARWTLEEETRLVASVRAGKDLKAIANEHGRTRGAITSRLVKMLPEERDIPDGERVGLIVATLTSDPDYDWQSHLHRTRLARDDSHAPSTGSSPAPAVTPLTEPAAILGIWQEVTGNKLSERHEREFLASSPVSDLRFFSSEKLTDTGRTVYRDFRELRLSTWAAECAVPGSATHASADDMAAMIGQVTTAIRAFITALITAVPDEDDRRILRRRLGLDGDEPETLGQVGDDLGLSRERIRQRQERAIRKTTASRVRPGYRTARDHAAAQLVSLLTQADGTANLARIIAIADLGFPGTHNGVAQRLLLHLGKHAESET